MRDILLCLFALGISVSAGAQQATATVIKASRMIDPRQDAPVDDVVIVVRGDVIEAAGPARDVEAPPGARTIDLTGYTLLPGLMDCHTHITGNPGDGGDTQRLREGVAYDAIYGVVNAKATLDAGFTTIRNVGAPGYADVALRNLIARGLVPGPRMWVATQSLGATGGHADINGWSPDIQLPGTAQIVDGVDDLRKAVRTQIKYGADLIKIVATGGILSSGDSFNAQQYSFEELKAVVDTAGMLGRKVAAHAHSPAGMNDAIRAGVASIEHGSLIDDEGIRLAKEHGTFVVPTLYTLDFIIDEGPQYGVPDYSIDKAKSMAKMQRERLGAAFHAGVKFAYGTDAGVFPHGRNAKDFRILVEQLDVRPIEAIRMATVNAAELIGIADRVGTLEPGKWADLIAVAGNPLEDITLLENVRFVMKGGAVYKSPTP
jgi:imidazolonepropionase-like amidohydrolase